MILPTMDDNDVAYEAFRVYDWLCDIFDELRPKVSLKFSKGTRYPYFQKYGITDDKQNDWVLVFYQLSKEMRRKKVYRLMAYTIYDIPPKRKENNINSGKGCIMFDPFRIRAQKQGLNISAMIYDFTPHAINRYTERYLSSIGKGNIAFEYKVESILQRWAWYDTSAKDLNTQKHDDESTVPYDLILHKGGMFRGRWLNLFLVRFATYIDNSMLFDTQTERQTEMFKEYWKEKANGTPNYDDLLKNANNLY